MFEMYEALPVMGGLLTGLVVSMLVGRQLRWTALIALSVVIGFAASTVSGEMGVCWGFVVFDILQVFVSAWVLLFALGYLRQRAAM